MTEALRLAKRMIELADGDATKGNLIIGSPLDGRDHAAGLCTMFAWGPAAGETDVERAVSYGPCIRPDAARDDAVVQIHADPQRRVAAGRGGTCTRRPRCSKSRSDPATTSRWPAPGTCAASRSWPYDGPQRDDCDPAVGRGPRSRSARALHAFGGHVGSTCILPTRRPAPAISTKRSNWSRPAVEAEYACGDMVFLASATAALVQSLLRRGGQTDLHEAQATIDRLAAVPTEPGFVMHDIWLLRMRAWDGAGTRRRRRLIATIATDIARWRIRLASKDISNGRRKWSDRSDDERVSVITGGAGGMGLATAKIVGRDHTLVLLRRQEGPADCRRRNAGRARDDRHGRQL